MVDVQRNLPTQDLLKVSNFLRSEKFFHELAQPCSLFQMQSVKMFE
jgi:hypothetical protein